jgi:hypothetical protein
LESWEKLTNPKTLRENLMSASVYISAYEMCREFIVSKPKDFFTDGWGDEETLSEEYKDEVCSFSKSPLKASLLWFKSLGAISDQDIDKMDLAREHRNEIAHNMPMFISDPQHEVNSIIFNELLAVTHKIGVYWILNYEIGIDPEFNGKEIDEDKIQIGTILMIQMTMKIAFGQEPEEGYFYNELKRKIKSKDKSNEYVDDGRGDSP